MQQGNFGGSINGICWPSVLGNILKNNVDDFGTSFASEVDHVFIETMGGAGWQLFAGRKNADLVMKKLRIKPNEKPVEPGTSESKIEKENQ